MEQVLLNAHTDSAHMHTLLDSEKAQSRELERELASVRSELRSKESECSRDQVEHAQLKGEFEVMQGSLEGVGESMQRATDRIKDLQQVGVAWGVVLEYC
jgi:septation ring formation regulator EzrA